MSGCRVTWITAWRSCHSLGRPPMGAFSILTNRKRAFVALIHSIVWLLVAVRQMVAATPAAGFWSPSPVRTGTSVLCGVFAGVSGWKADRARALRWGGRRNQFTKVPRVIGRISHARFRQTCSSQATCIIAEWDALRCQT
jgi:hypothetical protein